MNVVTRCREHAIIGAIGNMAAGSIRVLMDSTADETTIALISGTRRNLFFITILRLITFPPLEVICRKSRTLTTCVIKRIMMLGRPPVELASEIGIRLKQWSKFWYQQISPEGLSSLPLHSPTPSTPAARH